MAPQITLFVPKDAVFRKDEILGITIVENKSIQISPDLTSIATTAISNTGTVQAKIELKDSIGAIIQTIIEAPRGVDVKVGADGSIKQTLTVAKTADIETAKTDVVAKPTGEAELKIQSIQKAGDTVQVRELATPVGAKMELKDDGSAIAIGKNQI